MMIKGATINRFKTGWDGIQGYYLIQRIYFHFNVLSLKQPLKPSRAIFSAIVPHEKTSNRVNDRLLNICLSQEIPGIGN